jgi:hypothetical protein
MGTKRLDNLAALVRYGLDLQVTCRACRHHAVLSSVILLLQCKGSNFDRSLVGLSRRLKCGECDSKDVQCGPCFRT